MCIKKETILISWWRFILCCTGVGSIKENQDRYEQKEKIHLQQQVDPPLYWSLCPVDRVQSEGHQSLSVAQAFLHLCSDFSTV